MSKKHDFLRSEQNRDKHPDSKMAGSAASVQEGAARQGVQRVSPQDREVAQSPKYSNDHNKMGDTEPTQNTGGKGGGRGSRGGNVGGGS